VRVQGEPAVRITIKGLLIFCSLIVGLIMAEVVAASNQNDSASPAAVGFTTRTLPSSCHSERMFICAFRASSSEESLLVSMKATQASMSAGKDSSG
jgi:hypothetical protein